MKRFAPLTIRRYQHVTALISRPPGPDGPLAGVPQQRDGAALVSHSTIWRQPCGRRWAALPSLFAVGNTSL
jgi:hypothetical protein